MNVSPPLFTFSMFYTAIHFHRFFLAVENVENVEISPPPFLHALPISTAIIHSSTFQPY